MENNEGMVSLKLNCSCTTEKMKIRKNFKTGKPKALRNFGRLTPGFLDRILREYCFLKATGRVVEESSDTGLDTVLDCRSRSLGTTLTFDPDIGRWESFWLNCESSVTFVLAELVLAVLLCGMGCKHIC